MAPAALSTVYADAASVQNWLSIDGLTGRLDDDASGDNSAAESAYLTQAIQWASARLNLYCSAYPADELANSWCVSQWCSIIAAYFVSIRRGNPAAGSLKELYDETMEDLAKVKSGEFVLPDAAMRDSAFPAWSNVRVDVRYGVAKIRKETSISGRRGDQSGVVIDRGDQVIGPIEKAH